MAPEVSSSLTSSARHRITTRLRLIRMRPRRARYMRDLVAAAPRRPVPGGADRATGSRVLVIAHVYYPELWDELAAGIARIPGQVDVVVTLVAGRADHLAGSIEARFPGADVRVLANQGRDVWPLLQVLDRLPGHDAVLKVHTKRSPHMRNGDSWRRALLAELVGSTGRIESILGLLATDLRIGIVAPARNVLGREFLGPNRRRVESLAQQGRRTFDPDALWFPAGSMFWTRPEVLLPLAEVGLTAQDFGPETAAVDGTLAHAVERYIGVLAHTQDMAVIEAPDVDRLLRAAPSPLS
ncbi:MAG: rhamnan synthesis F family protein [Candidatus Nanopelagicales bacterium]|jgi:lipopolysaccharide biosynthesis protein|nr:rhamnan synthesis F family protein [Candidatus Nanopelagicales bacterium]